MRQSKDGDLETGIFFDTQLPRGFNSIGEYFLSVFQGSKCPWAIADDGSIPDMWVGEYWGGGADRVRNFLYCSGGCPSKYGSLSVLPERMRMYVSEPQYSYNYISDEGQWTPLGLKTVFFPGFCLAAPTAQRFISRASLLGIAVVQRSFEVVDIDEVCYFDERAAWGGCVVAEFSGTNGDVFANWVCDNPVCENCNQPLPLCAKCGYYRSVVCGSCEKSVGRVEETADGVCEMVVDGSKWQGEEVIEYSQRFLLSRRVVSVLQELGVGPLVVRGSLLRMDNLKTEYRKLVSEISRYEIDESNLGSVLIAK